MLIQDLKTYLKKNENDDYFINKEKNNMPKISIITPSYNQVDYLESTIVSILKQNYQNLEFIIMDGGSTDGSVEIFQNDTNIGPVKNWKRCIDEATGDYGKILWSDDLIASEFLEKTIPFLEDSDVGFVFTGTEVFIDGTSDKSDFYFIGNTGIYDSEQYINGVLLEGNFPVSPGCALFRLKDLKDNLLVNIPNKVGSDFAMHAIGNDLLIFLLTASQYKHFAFINEKLSYFRSHNDSISLNSSDGKLELFYSLAKACFIENYQKKLIKKYNTKLYILCKKYPKNKYGLKCVSDFYINNKFFSIDVMYFTSLVLVKIKDRINGK